MLPHWVNIIDRKPNDRSEVQVLVVRNSSRSLTGGDTYDIDYGSAKLLRGHWTFLGPPPQYGWVVAWLESDRRLDRSELEEIPKDSIRF